MIRTREAFSLPTLTLSTYHRLILIIGVTLGSHRLLMTQILCNNHDALNDQGGLQLGSPLLREKYVFVSAQVSWLTGGSRLCSTTDVKRNYRDDALGIIMWKKRGNEHCFILTVTLNIFYRFWCVWHINLSRCWQDFWLMLHFINDFVCRLCEIVVLSLWFLTVLPLHVKRVELTQLICYQRSFYLCEMMKICWFSLFKCANWVLSLFLKTLYILFDL